MMKRRGIAVIHTLALITLVMVMAFALASSTLSQLNLSAHYNQRCQADSTARAAMTEFVIRARKADPVKTVTALGPSVLESFRPKPMLLQPGGAIQGYATLQIDRCVDNGASQYPAAGYFDPAGTRSVPPFSLSVVYEVQLGSRSYTYESLVQQRWPYALTGPGPIVVPGRIGPDPSGGGSPEMPQQFWTAPSAVKGRVLALQADVGIESNAGGEDRLGYLKSPIVVSPDAYQALYPYAISGGLVNVASDFRGVIPVPILHEETTDRLTLGGPFTMVQLSYVPGSGLDGGPNLLGFPHATGGAQSDAEAVSRALAGSYALNRFRQDSRGAIVHRGADLGENLPTGSTALSTQPVVRVEPGNSLRGKVRYDYRVGGLAADEPVSRTEMQAMFAKPDVSQWPEIQISNQFAKELIITREPVVSPPSFGAVPPPTRYSAPAGQCRLVGNLKPVGYDLSKVGDAYAAALLAQYPWLPADPNVHGSLVLQDVALAVEGDVTLENYILKGSNATLLVDGNLTIDGGYLDAGDNGLVIFCRRLIMKAKGTFNGLIVAEKGAALYGSGASEPPSEPGLVIKGGLLVGGIDLLIKPSPAGYYTKNQYLPLTIRGLTLTSTRIEYEPRYLRGLNRFGTYEVLATVLH
ncbi:hypothetical protein IV102_15925 [bacterium]|nr:hypothetical protein [bacterium]